MGNDTAAPPARRSPMVAALLSGLFPGLGQLYNRQWRKAFLFFAGGVLASGATLFVDIAPDDLLAALRVLLLLSVPFLALALWSVIDAYRAAKQTQH